MDPPILLLVVSRLLVVVVLVGRVVVVVVDGGIWLRGSVVWWHQMNMGEKENKANVSTHPKYSASKDLHYICNIFKGGCICGLGCRNARIEGESLVLAKTSIFSIFIGLAALEECRLA